MSYDLKAIGQRAMNTVWATKDAVVNGLLNNKVADAVKPHFAKYVQPHLNSAYGYLPEHLKAHSHIAGGVAVVVALIAVKTFFSSGAKKA